MSGIFHRLQKRLELEKREQGISALDLASLPPKLRKIMRFMLRQVELPYTDLLKAMAEWPESDRMPQSELDEALKTLTVQGWLISRGEGERLRYEVNLRRKAGSKIAQGIWALLDGKMRTPAPENTPSEEGEDKPQEDQPKTD